MKCPDCNGEAGEYMDVIYKGIGGGPYEECCFCDDTGLVNVLKWVLYKIHMVWCLIRYGRW